jgi:uncharacterized protein (TIGR04562 family)
MDAVLGGRSAIDAKFFVGFAAEESSVKEFLQGYGLNYSDPIIQAELFGNFQEAIQFVKRYFLKEGNEDGLNLTIPDEILHLTDVSKLFLLATKGRKGEHGEIAQWAEVLLKIMHTILHVDKDLRSGYFSIIQTQIFDRFYKYIHRQDERLFIGTNDSSTWIELEDFSTKSKKTRDSVIIKLLHKAENVAEELFDRVGVRIITKNRYDTVRVMKFLIENFVVIPHNIKPSRSVNTMFDFEKFKEKHTRLMKKAMREKLSEEDFLVAMEKAIDKSPVGLTDDRMNRHSSSSYQSIQFTCRHLIKYKNPFLNDFSELRKDAKAIAKEDEDNELAKKVLDMDMSLISRDVRFFYPYEVQIVDEKAHQINSEGEASHVEYKKNQLQSAAKRLFKGLIPDEV